VGSMLLIFLFFSVILCFVCLRYVSCVPNVASVGGLSISDCLSVFYVCLTLPPFNDSACTKLGKYSAIYMRVQGIDFVSIYMVLVLF
jgi:hypothetical protein